jgi:uncharacterized protein YoxC
VAGIFPSRREVAMEVELIKALPGSGQLVVFVVVVIIFLRQMQTITQAFQVQISSLTDNVFRVSRETSEALTELAAAVRDLQGKVENNKSRPGD